MNSNEGNDRRRTLKLIHGPDGRDAGRSPGSRLPIMAAIIGLAVLFAAVAPQPGTEPEAQAAERLHGSSFAFEYFASQYINQATEEVEEPIPTF